MIRLSNRSFNMLPQFFPVHRHHLNFISHLPLEHQNFLDVMPPQNCASLAWNSKPSITRWPNYMD